MKYPVIFAAIAFTFASCGGGSEKTNTDTNNATQQETPSATTESAKPEPVTLTIEGNDQMQFNLKELNAKAGQEVTLILKHVGTMDKQSMGHNWVLLKQGADMTEFGMEAMKANDNNYIPKGTNKVIAHTDLIGGGEETSITFTAPAKGEYVFLCSFPGHFGTMHGNFIVE